MKLVVLIGTDYHVNQLPHFLAHYARVGVDTFVCGLHGQQSDRARALLARYPHVIVAEYGTARYDEVANSDWVAHFNAFRRAYVQPDEWCLFADVDEFHEYPADFFARLDPSINAIRGKWVERLATSDGQLLPCLPRPSIGQQFPFATREIFCGISEKIMAVRADLELIDGYHWIKGGTATPVYFPEYLNVHHFRWDDLAALKYQNVKWTRHYEITDGRVPDLRGVFAVDPPFPPATSSAHRAAAAHTTGDPQPDARPSAVIWMVGDEHSGVASLANLINARRAYRLMAEPLHPRMWRFISPENPYLYLPPHAGAQYLPIFRQIFSGQLHDDRADRQRQGATNRGGLLITESFGHLCLKWVDQHFPQVKKALVLRHPFAVALSHIKRPPEAGLDAPQRLFANPQLYAEVLRPFEDMIPDVDGEFEKQVLVWSIIHYIALVQLRGAQIHLIFYEELCANPERELRRLLADLGDDAADQPLDERLLRQFRTQHGDILEDWQRLLSPQQRDMADYILNVFGLGQLYNSRRLLPDRQAAAFMLKASSRAGDPARLAPAFVSQRSTPIPNAPSASDVRPCLLAYLIIAHDQPKHLGRLIHALDDEHSRFFIHIDAKAPLAPFKAAVPQQANVVFLTNRVAVQWGKLSVVQATLNLIQAAVASGLAFRYYTVLSGSDYPIKHKQDIATRLQTSDCQFLRIDRKLTNETTNSHRHVIKNLPQGNYFGDLTPYHGSMYWSLSADCIRFILDFVDNNPGYLDIHDHIFAPDEVFFHTIVKHSPFAAAITHDFSDGSYPDHTHHANHFIDWSGRRSRTSLTLDECDVDDLLASPALFARKFDERRSSRLLDVLDTHIHVVRSR